MDVAHLVLYHLSVCCKKKYFDFDREILPFTSENWDSLLLGEVRGGGTVGLWREREMGREGRKGSLLPGPHFPSSCPALGHSQGRTFFQAPLCPQQPQGPVRWREARGDDVDVAAWREVLASIRHHLWKGRRSAEGPFSITLTCIISLLTPVSFQEGRLRRGNACLVFTLGSLLLWSHLLEMEPPPGHWSREDGGILRVFIWG